MIASGEIGPSEAPSSGAIIASQAERLTKIVRQLLDFARRRSPNRSDVDLVDLAERMTQLLSALAKKAGVGLRVIGTDPVRSNVDAAQIEQALTNLVINGIQAMPKGGTLTIEVREETAAPERDPQRRQRCAVLEVTDEGHGIPVENLERIFEPFFTTKGVGEGTGLGLSVAHGIVEDHAGWMRATSTPGRGTHFAIYLPLERAATAAARAT
jgi:signal transduction histidine kinase